MYSAFILLDAHSLIIFDVTIPNTMFLYASHSVQQVDSQYLWNKKKTILCWLLGYTKFWQSYIIYSQVKLYSVQIEKSVNYFWIISFPLRHSKYLNILTFFFGWRLIKLQNIYGILFYFIGKTITTSIWCSERICLNYGNFYYDM